MVAREGSYPLAFTAHWLGVDSVQTIHKPSYSSELIATDPKSVPDDGAQRTEAGGGANGNACGEAELRTGPHAEGACDCERGADMINCAQIGWGL